MHSIIVQILINSPMQGAPCDLLIVRSQGGGPLALLALLHQLHMHTCYMASSSMQCPLHCTVTPVCMHAGGALACPLSLGLPPVHPACLQELLASPASSDPDESMRRQFQLFMAESKSTQVKRESLWDVK